jgi:pimeloyl-ACP methyl ester carboxylesterase
MSALPSGPDVPNVTHAYAYVNDIRVHYVHGGSNKVRSLLLVHGLFETWLMWRRILPRLMERHYVVAVDLRGYGETDKPAELERMTKASQAADFYALAQHLGMRKFVLIGHDRGARACRRYALDYPETLCGVALLDILPTEYIYQELTAGEAVSHHWDQLFHCASGISERLLKGREEAYITHFYNRSPGFLDQLKADGTWDAYLQAILQPGALEAMLNDYRAAFTIDVPHYRAELEAGTRITVPTLVLWGQKGNLARRATMDIWRARCTQVEGAEIPDCGHYLPEEQPEAVADHLLRFAEQCFLRV